MLQRGNSRLGTAWNWHIVGYSVLALFVALLASALIAHPADALTTVPTKMNFQGHLTDASGTVVADGLYNMKFALYTVSSGGSSVWAETRETTNRVQVTNGLFTTKLGDVSAMSATIFASGPLYFEITLANPATATCSTASCQTWEAAMTSRSLLSTSAYAYNAETLDGLDSAAFSQLTTANAFTNTNSITVASNANAFVVAGAYNLFRVDTSGTQVVVGTTDANANLFVLDVKNTAGDPTGTVGAMYYNSSAGVNKLRCYENGAWKDCIAADTLQTAYNNSSSPATITTTAAKGVTIAAGVAPTADMFTVSNTGFATTTANVNGIQVNYVGGAAAVEGSGIRIDSTPGTTSGGTWSGLRIVANATGAVSGVESYGIKIEGPSSPGAGSEVGLRVASGFDIGVDVASGGLQLSDMNDPAAPALGDLRVYAKSNAGRTMLKIKGGSGIDVALQPFLGANRVSLYQPTLGSTSITTSTTLGTTIGLNHFTSGTTASTTATTSEASASAASLFLSMKRTEIGTSTAASTVADLRLAVLQFMRGSTIGSASTGGFYVVGRFGVSTYQTGARTFAGMAGMVSALGNAEITTFTNVLGFGCNTADTSFSFIYNDASGTASKTTLGGNFPCNTSDTDMYEYRLFVAPAGTTVYYSLARLNTTDFIEGSVTTDLPAVGQFLTPHFYIGNNATAARAELDIASLYVETDN